MPAGVFWAIFTSILSSLQGCHHWLELAKLFLPWVIFGYGKVRSLNNYYYYPWDKFNIYITPPFNVSMWYNLGTHISTSTHIQTLNEESSPISVTVDGNVMISNDEQ